LTKLKLECFFPANPFASNPFQLSKSQARVELAQERQPPKGPSMNTL
jgi:hypothetical protein